LGIGGRGSTPRAALGFTGRFSLMSDGQHRSIGKTNDLLGDATEHHPRNAFAPMGSHHNPRRIFLSRNLEDLFDWVAISVAAGYLPSLILGTLAFASGIPPRKHGVRQ
jgi:hypothetical protein